VRTMTTLANRSESRKANRPSRSGCALLQQDEAGATDSMIRAVIGLTTVAVLLGYAASWDGPPSSKSPSAQPAQPSAVLLTDGPNRGRTRGDDVPKRIAHRSALEAYGHRAIPASDSLTRPDNPLSLTERARLVSSEGATPLQQITALNEAIQSGGDRASLSAEIQNARAGLVFEYKLREIDRHP